MKIMIRFVSIFKFSPKEILLAFCLVKIVLREKRPKYKTNYSLCLEYLLKIVQSAVCKFKDRNGKFILMHRNESKLIYSLKL